MSALANTLTRLVRQGVCFVGLDHFRHLLKSFTTAVEFETRHAVSNSGPLVEEIKTPLGAGGRTDCQLADNPGKRWQKCELR